VTRRNCSAVATFHADSREPPGTGVGAIEMSLLRLSPGGRLERSNFPQVFMGARDSDPRNRGVASHDLPDIGNTLVAFAGGSTRELMARMGHASASAALIYQHVTRERDAAIAPGTIRTYFGFQPDSSTLTAVPCWSWLWRLSLT
jgi:Phage integrase family.